MASPFLTASSPPEVTLTAPEESAAVVSFADVPSLVTRLSVESRYAYAALCACALDRCRLDARESSSSDAGFSRRILFDVVAHVGLTPDDVWRSLGAIVEGKGQIACGPFIETLKQETMTLEGAWSSSSTYGGGAAFVETASTAFSSHPALSISPPSTAGASSSAFPPPSRQTLAAPDSRPSSSRPPLSPVHNSRNFCLLFFVQDLVTLAVQEAEGYDSRWRVFVKEFALLLHINVDFVDDIEEAYIEHLRRSGDGVGGAAEDASGEASQGVFKKKAARYLKIGLAGAVGGTLVGLTGGLAVPFIAAGTGAIIGTAGAAVIASSAGAAIIGSAFGVGGAGLIGYRMKRRVGGLEQFEFEPLVVDESLHVGVAVAGWLQSDADDSFKTPWVNLMLSKEQYALKWEGKYLLELGRSLDYLLRVAVQKAGVEALKYTVLSGVMSAVAWPVGILGLSHAIDNPWSVCMNRSALAGKQLARVLLAREQGKRPVSLIGFSLGARVIFSCLKELAASTGDARSPLGVVENVVVLGAPLPGDAASWAAVTPVVAGRVINGYCRSDWMLKFLYRTSSGNSTIAGLRPIEIRAGGESSYKILNFDLTDIVSGHTDYAEKVGQILKTLGLQTSWTGILSRSTSRSSINSIRSDPPGGGVLDGGGGVAAAAASSLAPTKSSRVVPSASTPSFLVPGVDSSSVNFSATHPPDPAGSLARSYTDGEGYYDAPLETGARFEDTANSHPQHSQRHAQDYHRGYENVGEVEQCVEAFDYLNIS